MERAEGHNEEDLLHPPREAVIELIQPIIVGGFGELAEKRAGEQSLHTLMLNTHYSKSSDTSVEALWTPEGADKALLLASDLSIEDRRRFSTPDLTEEARDIGPAGHSTLWVAGGTEDNVTKYYGTTWVMFDGYPKAQEAEAWWVSDETKHQMTYFSYQLLSQWGHPELIEEMRTHQIASGEAPQFKTPEDMMFFTSWQEPFTRVSHANGSRTMPRGSVIRPVLGKTADQEMEHFVPYFASSLVIVEAYPDRSLVAIAETLHRTMPGVGIDNFEEHSKVLEAAGVLDRVDAYNVYRQLIEAWGVLEIEPKTAASAEAKEDIVRTLRLLKHSATRLEKKRAEMRAGGIVVKSLADPIRQNGQKVEVSIPNRPKEVGKPLKVLEIHIAEARDMRERLAT